MKSISDEVIRLYSDLQRHTFKDCLRYCDHIDQCCDSRFCERSRAFAASHGITLHDTGHPTLPFMGPHGCTIEPYLRPECTEFVCCIRDHQKRPGDEEWTHEYFRLRKEILLAKGTENG